MFEQILRPVLIMSSVYLIQIFGSFIAVEEFQNLFTRDNTVKIAIDKQYWHLVVKFFKNIQIVDRKDVILYLLGGSLFDKIKQRLNYESWKIDFSRSNSLDDFGKIFKWTV